MVLNRYTASIGNEHPLSLSSRTQEPIGRLTQRMEIAEGLVLDKITAPIGVLLVIFEVRKGMCASQCFLLFQAV